MDLDLLILRKDKLNKQYLHAKRKAERANSTKDHFLASMSHELRTPLNSVLGFSHILTKKEKELSPENMKMIYSINNSGEILLGLINDLLDISSISANKLRLNMEVICLEELLDSTGDIFSDLIRNKNLDFNFIKEKNLPDFIEGDSLRIKQVLINLLNNSLKYTIRGKIDFITGVHYTTENRADLIIKINDTGIGFPDEKKEEIFYKYTRINNFSNNPHGLGLGLSIVKKLVKIMEGTIDVESRENRGTCFTVTIPFNVLKSENIQTIQRIAPEKLTVKGNHKILLAEDNETNQELILKMLEKTPLDVEVVSDGQTAVNHFNKNNYSMILMDIQMPVMDGLEATMKIRKTKKYHDHKIPIIALTAFAMKKDRQKCLDSGMDEYLTKPIRMDKLLRVIAKYLKL